MAIQGLFSTADWLTEQRPQEWRQAMLLHYPNGGKMPLTALTSLMGSERTSDPQFNWFTKEFSAQRFNLGGNIAAVAAGAVVTLTLATAAEASMFKKDHMILIEESGNLVRVTANPTTAAIACIALTGGTTAVTYNGVGVNPYITIVGTAHPEGDTMPVGIARNPLKFDNLTQIFRNSLELTRTAMQTRLRTPQQVKEAKREALEFHGIEMEKAFLFGAKEEDLSGSTPRRTTQGIYNFLAAAGRVDATDYTSGISMDALELALFNAFEFGADEKMAFCGRRAILAMQQVVRKNTSYRITNGESEYGMKIGRFDTPFGSLVLKQHPLLSLMPYGSQGGTDYLGRDGDVLILDMGDIKYRFVQDTKYLPNRASNDLDGDQSEYLTEAGLEFHHPTNHYCLRGVHSGIVDP